MPSPPLCHRRTPQAFRTSPFALLTFADMKVENKIDKNLDMDSDGGPPDNTPARIVADEDGNDGDGDQGNGGDGAPNDGGNGGILVNGGGTTSASLNDVVDDVLSEFPSPSRDHLFTDQFAVEFHAFPFRN